MLNGTNVSVDATLTSDQLDQLSAKLAGHFSQLDPTLGEMKDMLTYLIGYVPEAVEVAITRAAGRRARRGEAPSASIGFADGGDTVEDCPAWCVREHIPGDPDREHESDLHAIDMSQEPDAELMTSMYQEPGSEPYVGLSIDDQHGVTLTLDEAERHACGLLALIHAARTGMAVPKTPGA